jgi:pyridoxal phosphate enzyme (YggS family)
MPLADRDATERLSAVCARVERAARAAGRDPGDVRILLATKTQDADTIVAAVGALARLRGAPVLIGENRVQELVAKAPALAPILAAPASEPTPTAFAHFIGHLQSNKVNQVLGVPVACIESINSHALAAAVSARCERAGRHVDVMVQVNVSGEASKSGVAPAEAMDLALAVAAMPGLRLTGFMTIGLNSDDEGAIRAGYARLRAIRDDVLAGRSPGTTEAHELSMGMSGDLELAIAEGATIVRIGTALFGPR